MISSKQTASLDQYLPRKIFNSVKPTDNMGRQSMQDKISTCALCDSSAPSWSSGQYMSGEQCKHTSYWHLGQVPVTNRSARNLPAASLYSCSMVCSTSCPALSSVLKMPWAVKYTHINMATPLTVASTDTKDYCGPFHIVTCLSMPFGDCSCSKTAFGTGTAIPCCHPWPTNCIGDAHT